jgi:hypothetical protein
MFEARLLLFLSMRFREIHTFLNAPILLPTGARVKDDLHGKP